MCGDCFDLNCLENRDCFMDETDEGWKQQEQEQKLELAQPQLQRGVEVDLRED